MAISLMLSQGTAILGVMPFTDHMQLLPPAVRGGVEEMVERGDVDFVLLFGSLSRGTCGPMSDVDLAVQLSSGTLDAFQWKISWLPRLSGPGCDVDLVIVSEASLALRFRIVRDGLPLWVGDEAALNAFKFESTRDWLDFEPMLRIHDKALVDRVRDGSFGKETPGNG